MPLPPTPFQILDFADAFVGVGAPVAFAANSVGGVAALQAAVDAAAGRVRAIVLLNISLRMLHITKQSW